MSVLFVRPEYPEGYKERLLLAAILRRAAFDIALYKNAKRLMHRRLWMDAYRWLMDDSNNHFTSFMSICDVLDQDPAWIRSQTLRMKREDVRKFDMVDR